MFSISDSSAPFLTKPRQATLTPPSCFPSLDQPFHCRLEHSRAQGLAAKPQADCFAWRKEEVHEDLWEVCVKGPGGNLAQAPACRLIPWPTSPPLDLDSQAPGGL